MSATNRGGKRLKDDTYKTPEWAVEAFVPELKKMNSGPRWILEPGAGTGNIVKVLRRTYPNAKIHAIEKHKNFRSLKKAGANIVTIKDYLDWPGTRANGSLYDLAVGNPPYSLAMEFIQHTLAKARVACFLMRLNWLASQRRSAWLRDHTPGIFVLPKRPSFRPGGTDACEYGWLVWGWGGTLAPTVKILDTSPWSLPRGGRR